MDDTQASTKSTDASTATRKRRSSILKNQRPPRTPLSELEFNVATPTDAIKSRRVSFSRRTGVAEFVTNEATTTWKTFYEEHNNSLESSGLDVAGNARHQPLIGHIGKRIFDQQFQEVEVEDIGYALQPNSLAQNFHTSLNNLNITQQLLSLECPGDDRGLCAPIQNMTLSSLSVHQSKIFGDDLNTNEISNPISVNLSNMQPINLKDTCDDLDEIVKDLERSQSAKMLCRGPFSDEREMSEYIEVDLNMTHADLKNDDCDLSLTGTIQNPEVQINTKFDSFIPNDKNSDKRDVWIIDKENIAVNPYITPKESVNFAVNESTDKILIFDGKKLKMQTERKSNIYLEDKNKSLPDLSEDPIPKKNTIIVNEDVDLPSNNSTVSANKENNSAKDIPELKQSIIYNECELSITQGVNNNIELPIRKTIVYENGPGNMSITQAIPAKVIINKREQRKTVIYHHNTLNFSLAEAIPAEILNTNESLLQERKTIVYEDDNISFTQALPANLIFNDKTVPLQNNTLFYQEDAGMSITQSNPENINVVNDCSDNIMVSNISMTQALPSNILTTEPKLDNTAKTVMFDSCDDVDVDLTKAVSENVILSVKKYSEKNKTIVYENDADDISITETIPDNIIFEKRDANCGILKVEDRDSVDIENTTNKRQTIIYNDDANMSVTQIMPSNIILSKDYEIPKIDIIKGNSSADSSITLASTADTLLKTENGINEAFVYIKPVLQEKNNGQSLRNINTKDNEICDTSQKENHFASSKLNNYETSQSTLSTTKPIPIEILNIQNNILKHYDAEVEKSTLEPKTEAFLFNDTNCVKQDIIVYQSTEHDNSKSQLKDENCLKIEKNMDTLLNISLKDENNYITDIPNLSGVTNYSNNEICSKIISVNNMDKRKEILESEHFSSNPYLDELASKELIIEKNIKNEKSILNELLDMSNASLDDVVRSRLNDTPPDVSPKKLITHDIKQNNDNKSIESLFVILTDNDDNAIDQVVDKNYSEKMQKTVNRSPSPLLITKSEDVQDLQNKIAALKAANEDRTTSTNRRYEKVVSSLDVQNSQENLNNSDLRDRSGWKCRKSFKKADDTKELLGMLADFTEESLDEKDQQVGLFEVKNDIAVEDCKQKRSSFYPNRKSIALSREDLLHTISMAQTALQQSQFEMDGNESAEDTCESLENVTEETDDKTRRKSVRMSTEVVKKLQFEDEDSVIDTCPESDIKASPLKKTVFGETSYMKDSKAKVIPTYLKDVSDNIKALMNDLVKPMADVMPFDSICVDKPVETPPSTCSTQIQANLTTSSQIDIDVELHSNTESGIDVKSEQSMAQIAALGNKAISQALKHSIEPVSVTASMEIDRSPIPETTTVKRVMPHTSESGPVIVFDHINPLNNVLLAPADYVKAHRYNPLKVNSFVDTEQENVIRKSIDDNGKDNNLEVKRLSTQYHIEMQQPTLRSGDTVEMISDSNSLISNISKPLSIDRSIGGLITEVKDTEANTVIVMKANKELLQVNSSLTLVDDAFAQSAFDINTESASSEETNGQKSPLRVIYQMETNGEMVQKKDSDFMSNDDELENFNANGEQLRKRSYSPTKRDISKINDPHLDVTPKPVSKMLKISNSPKTFKSNDDRRDEISKRGDNEHTDDSESPKAKTNISGEKMKSSKHKISPGSNEFTVQRTSIHRRHSQRDQRTVERKIQEVIQSIPSTTLDLESLSQNLGVSSEDSISCTSSRDADIVTSQAASSVGSNVSRVNWQPELLSELSSKNLITECSSRADVVAKIDSLPFMGRECEWESASGDAWSFRLLRGRVRLSARLRPARAGAPLAVLAVDPAHSDETDPLASVCVRLAAEAMRYECARGASGAGAGGATCAAADVPALLRRCAALARVALRWARAMRQARLRLAYGITPQGELTLKVANVALRSVWEVRLLVELVVEDAREAAWPRARLVRASPALADGAPAPPLEDVTATLPRGWGHAPAAVWKVFKYLKNRTREDEFAL